MARPVLLDTCAAIWLMNGDPMSADSRASVTVARSGNLGVYLSPMSAWGIATLAAFPHRWPLVNAQREKSDKADRDSLRRAASAVHGPA
jgi:PIN domain nuclease of toxin-antitoxin system